MTPSGRDVLEGAVHRRRRGGAPPLDPPPPPPLPMFEAESQSFASVPSVPRGFTLQKFRPAFGGDHRRTLGGGGVPAKPPKHPPFRPPPPSSPPPPLPMFEAESQSFASAPSVPRGLKPKNFRPAFGGDHRGTLGGGGVPAKPPTSSASKPPSPPSNTSLASGPKPLHRRYPRPNGCPPPPIHEQRIPSSQGEHVRPPGSANRCARSALVAHPASPAVVGVCWSWFGWAVDAGTKK